MLVPRSLPIIPASIICQALLSIHRIVPGYTCMYPPRCQSTRVKCNRYLRDRPCHLRGVEVKGDYSYTQNDIYLSHRIIIFSSVNHIFVSMEAPSGFVGVMECGVRLLQCVSVSGMNLYTVCLLSVSSPIQLTALTYPH